LNRYLTGGPLGEIAVQVRLEFVQQHGELRIVELARGGDVGGVHDDGAEPLDGVDGALHHGVGRRTVPHEVRSANPEPGALQPVRVEKRGVIGARLTGARSGGVVAWFYSGVRTQ